MKIIAFYEDNNGGETVVTENLLKVLIRNKSLKILTKNTSPLSRTNILNFYLWVLKCIFTYFLYLYNYKKYISVVYTTTYTAGFAAAILKPLRKYKLFFHYHGSKIPPKSINSNLYHRTGQFMKYYLSYHLHKIFVTNCDKIITPTKLSKNELLTNFPFLKSGNIVVIPNGINLKQFTPTTLEGKRILRKKLNISLDSKVILNIGRINKWKRNLELLSILKEVNKVDKNTVLIFSHPKIISEEDQLYKTKILNEIKARNLENNVIWKIEYNNIPELYKIADMVVLLSKREILPTVILEAFATNVIVIATPIGACKNLLSNVDPRLIINGYSVKEIVKTTKLALNLSLEQKHLLFKKQTKVVKNYSQDIFASNIYSLFTREK